MQSLTSIRVLYPQIKYVYGYKTRIDLKLIYSSNTIYQSILLFFRNQMKFRQEIIQSLNIRLIFRGTAFGI